MAIAAKITNADRAAVVRFAWGLAYLFAVRAVQPVRGHIGAGMREAWALFRKARAEGIMPEHFTEIFEEKIGRTGRVEARAYLKAEIARKAAEASAPAPVEETVETDQLSLLQWIVDDAIRAGEPGLYAVDQVEPVAPPLVMASVKAATVAEPKPVQLSIIDLIDADVPEVVVPEVVGIPETAMPDQDDEEALEQVVIEEVFDPRQELIARIARNNAAMARLEQDIQRDAEILGSGAVDQMYDRLDDLHTHGLNLRDELMDLGHPSMVPPAPSSPSFNAIR